MEPACPWGYSKTFREMEWHEYATESKLALLASLQANKSGDEVLRQGIMTLFGKLAD